MRSQAYRITTLGRTKQAEARRPQACSRPQERRPQAWRVARAPDQPGQPPISAELANGIGTATDDDGCPEHGCGGAAPTGSVVPEKKPYPFRDLTFEVMS
ncbi:unnamed protein product, partial [Musa textilis]